MGSLVSVLVVAVATKAVAHPSVSPMWSQPHEQGCDVDHGALTEALEVFCPSLAFAAEDCEIASSTSLTVISWVMALGLSFVLQLLHVDLQLDLQGP